MERCWWEAIMLLGAGAAMVGMFAYVWIIILGL